MMYSSKFVFRLIHFFVIILIVNCEDGNYFEDTINEEEFIDPHSFFFDKQSKTMIEDVGVDMTKDLAETNIETQNNLRSYNEMNNCNIHEAAFYQRLVNLLLSNLYIQNQNEVSITGTLEIAISHSQIETLQNFRSHGMSLREVDEILSDVIQKPKYNNYTLGIKYIFDMLHQAFHAILKTVQDYPDGVLILFVMIMVGLTFRTITRGQKLPIFGLIQVMFVLSFFVSWWQLIKETEIKFAAEQMKFSEIPISCHPDKMSTWDKIVTFFYGDDCEKYYIAMVSNPKLQITPIHALSHFVCSVIFYPITYFGTVVSTFVNNATGDLSCFYAWTIKYILYICISVVMIIILCRLCGASINMGLGSLLKFGINFGKTSGTGNLLENVEKREPVQVILKLSPVVSVPQIEGTLKTKHLNALQDSEKCCAEEVAIVDNDTKKNCDLCCGDTAENNKLSKHNDDDIKTREIINAVKTEKNDGRGDY